MSSSRKIDNKKKDILILGKGSTQVLELTLSAEKYIPLVLLKIIFCFKFCLSLQYNRAISYLFLSGKEIHKYKA